MGGTGSGAGRSRGGTHLLETGIKARHVNPARDGMVLEGWHDRSVPSAMGWTGVRWVLQPLGLYLGRTIRLEDVVNWGFIEVLHQFGLKAGQLFGDEQHQWTSLQEWLLQAEVSREAGGTQAMVAHSHFPPGHPCSQGLGGATLLLPALRNLTLAARMESRC